MSKFVFQDLVINPEEYSVIRNGQVIKLPKLSFELLIYLVEHVGEVCSIEQICKGVWKTTVVSNDTVIQRITLLRKSLGDDPKSPKYIESIRGLGYRLITPSPASKNLNKIYVILTCVILTLAVGLSTRHWFQNRTSIDTITRQLSLKNELIQRGQHYLEVGQSKNIERAIELFRQALIDSPNNSEAQLGLSFALSRSVCRYGQPHARADEAKQIAENIVNHDKTVAKAQQALAYSFDCLGYLDAALQHYLKAAELSANSLGSISSAAHLYQVKGQLLEAYKLNIKTKALQADNPFADLQLARLYELLKFTSQAEAAYQKLFILYPDNVFINAEYPRFLFYQGRFSEAKEIYEKTIARGMARSDSLLSYATLIWLLEGQAAALPWLQKAVQHNPNNSFAETIQKIQLAQLSQQHAIHKIADIEFRVAAGDTWPHNYLEAAMLASEILKDPTQAIQLLQKSVELGYLDSEYLTISPLFALLRTSPEFYQIVNDINQRRATLNQQFLELYAAPMLKLH